ncbi:geranylgeranyl reductase family protein [Oceanitalea stevensii]|uniref:Geranylgeranyl reductase family protein n=1 Tax=Oceanitalea stevensii TaxID=2763072 RepID=A0ABR8Z063_9MICO|nr:geranylgeranyl reductase family protein [Oceanitalea stevensii]MBD8061685.1 geranylgeranyl reductase family protein [Oceanitalea stevensii]HLU29527.1 geranylgeranyl reductase family protein [Glycomyces sp.]
MRAAHDDADVIVVGAGPAGSATAHYLAQTGLDVLLLEKATFPRDKICGDGLTPRAVAELIRMGVPTEESDGWIRNWGLRTYGAGHRIEIPWPELAEMPSYGLARSRMNLDETLARHAAASGARLREGVAVTGPVRHERSGRILGVTTRSVDAKGRRTGEERSYHARIVVDAGGVSARLATTMGIEKNDNRPMGVAIRTYFRSPRHDDPMMESHLELWDGEPGRSNLMPGYGWIFALGDGTVNVGLGSLSSTAKPTKLDYKGLFATWMRNAPAEWEFTPENQVGELRSAALPMAFNRKPHYSQGMLLVGDSGGMVSPFNGEGIAYAMQSGRIAADVVSQALARTTPYAMEKALRTYPAILADELGGYFTMGQVFARLIERPEIMRACVKYGLPRPVLMRFVMKLLSDGFDRRDGDWMDRLIAALSRAVPAS